MSREFQPSALHAILKPGALHLIWLRCDIIEELASNFPTAASNLLNIAPQASRDVQTHSDAALSAVALKNGKCKYALKRFAGY
eukprot:scaffold14511_cov23-Tisochrysis_lutea.AAC.4